MADQIRIVSVRTGALVAKATVRDDGTVAYEGGESARSLVRSWLRTRPHLTEAGAVRVLASAGWSNGYLMVELG